MLAIKALQGESKKTDTFELQISRKFHCKNSSTPIWVYRE